MGSGCAVRFQPIQPVGGAHVCKLLLQGGGGGGGGGGAGGGGAIQPLGTPMVHVHVTRNGE